MRAAIFLQQFNLQKHQEHLFSQTYSKLKPNYKKKEHLKDYLTKLKIWQWKQLNELDQQEHYHETHTL